LVDVQFASVVVVADAELPGAQPDPEQAKGASGNQVQHQLSSAMEGGVVPATASMVEDDMEPAHHLTIMSIHAACLHCHL